MGEAVERGWRERPRQPVTVVDDVYEVRAVARFRVTALSPTDAGLRKERLRSDALKLAVFLLRKLGYLVALDVEWDEPKLVGKQPRVME